MSKPQPGDPEDHGLNYGFGPRVKVDDNVWDGSVPADHPKRIRRITRLFLEQSGAIRICLASPNRYDDDTVIGCWLAADETGWRTERARYLRREIEDAERGLAKLTKELESLKG
jgi:hypothetical protein